MQKQNIKQPNLDLQKSLEQNPPNYEAGITFKKRIRVQRNKCTWPLTQEFRTQGRNRNNTKLLTDSYEVNGFLYNKPVQVVEVDPENKDRFIGISGYNRNAAQKALKWDVAIYDIVEYKTPRDRLVSGYTLNHHIPADPTIEVDIKKGISTAVTEGIITNSDVDVKALIVEIAADKTNSQKKSIFDSYRRNNSAFENLESFGSVRANKLATELNIPYQGDKNYANTGLHGYVKEVSVHKQLMYDGLETWLREDEPIYVTGYVTYPTPQNLNATRLSEKKKINKLNNFIYEIAAKVTGMQVDEIKKKGKTPFIYNGFLPQVISADPTNGGLPVETGRVDYDGTPML